MFLCLTSNKRLKVYLNSELIFEKEIDNVTEGLRLPKDFLKNLQIGKASAFTGELSELNIWSKVLTDDKINDLYECKAIPEDWKTEEFQFGPNIIVGRSHLIATA